MVSSGLEVLRQKFITRCRGDLELVRALAIDTSRGAEPAVRTVIHRISGIAGSLGYADLSDLARRVDDGFSGAVSPSPEDVRHLAAELARVAGEV
jgi:HPt (histidine-containing phosphotransfer) domain-containing protein